VTFTARVPPYAPVPLGRRGSVLFSRDLSAPDTIAELRQRFGLVPEPAPAPIEYVFAGGLEVGAPTCALPVQARELPGDEGRVLRLSDHPPVIASFRLPKGRAPTPPRCRRRDRFDEARGCSGALAKRDRAGRVWDARHAALADCRPATASNRGDVRPRACLS
jgi:hypothetical protein